MIKKGDNVILKFNSDDTICRQRCKAYIYESMENALMYKFPNETLVEYAPVKRGHWIINEDGNFCNAKCSSCDKDYACHYGMLQLQMFNHCPNCGAKMEYKEYWGYLK